MLLKELLYVWSFLRAYNTLAPHREKLLPENMLVVGAMERVTDCFGCKHEFVRTWKCVIATTRIHVDVDGDVSRLNVQLGCLKRGKRKEI